jgi:carbonic anhydrase
MGPLGLRESHELALSSLVQRRKGYTSMKKWSILLVVFSLLLTGQFVFAAEPAGEEYVVKAGDQLNKIAEEYLDEPQSYLVIVEATNMKAKEDSHFTAITDPNAIEVGQTLWIPTETGMSTGQTAAAASSGLTAGQALEMQLEGNRRYVSGQSIHPNQTLERRAEVVGAQKPFAAILSCSDSRVPPEILFDQGIGDLFVIRNAGNVSDDVVLGSIEYGVANLAIPLVVVLGHQSCGAVSAATQSSEAPGHIEDVVMAIQPAVEKAKGQEGDLVTNAISANVGLVVEEVAGSEPILSEFVRDHGVQVVGAVYSLENGTVELQK